MSRQVKHRRGTTVNHSTFTGVEGEFTYDTTNSAVVTHDGIKIGGYPNGGYLQGETATKRSVNNKLQDFISVTDFGAVADFIPGTPGSGTDNTAAFNAAFTAGRHVYIPAGNYKVGALTINKRIHLYGAGMDSARLYSTVGATINALSIYPPAGVSGAENRFYYFHDFSLEPTVDGGGHDGFYVELASGAFMSNSVIERVHVGNFSHYGMHLNNAPFSNLDGFFTTTIRRCWVTNGLYLQKCGDSITVAENTLTGSNLGLFATGLSGARQLIIRDNNITNSGGALFLSTTEQPCIYNNQMEMLSPVYTGAYTAWVYIASSYMPTLRDNTITGRTPTVVTPPTHTILFDGTTSDAIVDNNYIHIGATSHISIAPTVVSTRIAGTNRYAVAYTGAEAIIDNQGVDTIGVRRPMTSYSNSWVSYDAVNQPVTATKNVEGWVNVTGAISGGTSTAGAERIMCTLPSGVRPGDRKIFTVPARSGTTWATATVIVDIDGTISNYGVTGNAELHLNGIQFRVRNP